MNVPSGFISSDKLVADGDKFFKAKVFSECFDFNDTLFEDKSDLSTVKEKLTACYHYAKLYQNNPWLFQYATVSIEGKQQKPIQSLAQLKSIYDKNKKKYLKQNKKPDESLFAFEAIYSELQKQDPSTADSDSRSSSEGDSPVYLFDQNSRLSLFSRPKSVDFNHNIPDYDVKIAKWESEFILLEQLKHFRIVHYAQIHHRADLVGCDKKAITTFLNERYSYEALKTRYREASAACDSYLKYYKEESLSKYYRIDVPNRIVCIKTPEELIKLKATYEAILARFEEFHAELCARKPGKHTEESENSSVACDEESAEEYLASIQKSLNLPSPPDHDAKPDNPPTNCLVM